MTKATTNTALKAGTMSGWDFPITFVKEVPLVRTSTSLPINWDALRDAFENKPAGSESPSITIPVKFWSEVRKVPTAELKPENMAGRLKAAFAGWRAGREKADGGKMLPFGLTIVEVKNDKGEWEGHQLYIAPQDVEARKVLVERLKKAAKKGPAKKTAAKKSAAK